MFNFLVVLADNAVIKISQSIINDMTIYKLLCNALIMNIHPNVLNVTLHLPPPF